MTHASGIVVVAVFAFTTHLLSIFAMALTYRRKGFIELRNITLGFIFASALPLNYIIAFFIESPQYNQFRTIMGVVCVDLAAIGLLIYWVNIKRLQSRSNLATRLIMYVYLICLGVLSMSLRWRWVEDNWHAIYTPKVGLVPFSILSIIIYLDLIYLSSLHIRQSNDRYFEQMMILMGWILNMISMIWIMIERIFFSGYTLNFLLISGFGFFLVCLGIFQYPYAIFPRNIGLQYLILVKKEGSIPFLKMNFHSTLSHDRLFLFGGAVASIMDLLDQIMGSSGDNTHVLEYQNYHLIIDQNDGFLGFFVVEHIIPPIFVVLDNILQFTSLIKIHDHYLEPEEVISLKEMIIDELDFVMSSQEYEFEVRKINRFLT